MRKNSGTWMSIVIALCLALFSLSDGHAADIGKKPLLQFGRNQEIQQVKPKKPVKIKLHRSPKGEYSWDLSGDSVDEVVRADSRLRKLLKVEEEQK